MRTIGVLDRTGTLLGPLEQLALDGPEAEVVDLGSPVGFGPHSPRVDVLLLGPRELTPTGLWRVAGWHKAHPASAVAAAVDAVDGWSRKELDAHDVRSSFRGRPTPSKLLRVLAECGEELDRLSADVAQMDDQDSADAPSVPAWAQPRTEEAVDPVAEEEPTSAARTPADGLLVTVASASGGSGKTFFATNLAAHLARQGQRVLLVDVDLQFGEVAPVLQMRHPYSVYDGLYGRGGEALPRGTFREQLDVLVCRHTLGFDVLTAPRDPSLADHVGAADAVCVLDAVLPRYDTVIVDTPPSLNEVVLVALDRSDVVAVMATLDVPSLKNLGVFLKTLERLRPDCGGLRLILNKVEEDVGITVKQAQDAFDGRFVGWIPADRGVSRSINAGAPIVAGSPRSHVAHALVDTIRSTLASPVGGQPASSTAKHSRRTRHRRSARRPLARGGS